MTKIEWTHRPGTTGETWNPVTGCDPISEGCTHCWAKRMSKRLAGRFGYSEDEPFRVTLHPDRLDEPLHWKKPRTVFVCSMGDLFHEAIPLDYVADVFDRMARCPVHTFILLTKRPEQMNAKLQQLLDWSWSDVTWTGRTPEFARSPYPLPNLWLGVTAENQRRADERIPLLLQCPAAVRFVSIEPMLGPVDLSYWQDYDVSIGERPALDWIIVGGETGPGARPMRPWWVQSVRDQCVSAGVPFFFKKWGDWGRNLPASDPRRQGHLLDGKEWHQWPS